MMGCLLSWAYIHCLPTWALCSVVASCAPVLSLRVSKIKEGFGSLVVIHSSISFSPVIRCSLVVP
ncbi:hypothetical protein HanIR_Chr16g0831551 [Helianthus annuus]|nr:hypothetical protein HanIR_Chr16g0831551 [Helianthus annuus]